MIYGSKNFRAKTIFVIPVASAIIAMLLCCPLPLQAKSSCNCYGCCIDNCEAISLRQEDLGKKNLKLAIKSCNRGCSIIHWLGTSHGELNQKKAEKELNKACIDKDIAYPDYCISAIGLWGKNCGKTKQPKQTKESKQAKQSDIDERFRQLEASARENIARNIIKMAFPDLPNEKFLLLMKNSTILRGIDFRTVTTPLRLTDSIKQAINRVSEAAKQQPTKELKNIDEILALVNYEVMAESPSNSSVSKATPNPARKTTPRPTEPSLVKYKGLPPDKVNTMLQKELESVMALLSKPGVSNAELRTAVDKLLNIYDSLEKEIKDPQVKQHIVQLKATLRQLRSSI